MRGIFSSSLWRQFGIPVALAFWACGGNAAETGVSDKEIVIGQSIALEDGRNSYGVAVAEGSKLYIDMINAAGGVHGRKITVRVMDDHNKANVAESNSRRLVAEGAFILFGSIEGGPSTGVMTAASELKVPFFGPMAGSPTLRRPHQPYVFPVRAEHRDEFRALMQWGRSTGLATVGFIHADSDVGRSHLENVKLIAGELGMKVTLAIPFKGEISDAQIDDMVKLIGDRKPDLFFNHGSSGLYLKLVSKARAARLPTAFMGVNSGSTQIAHGLGPQAQGMVFAQVVPNPWERKHPIAREYQDALRQANAKAEYSYGALEGFMTAKALVMGLRAAGRDLTRAGYMKTLENSHFDLGGVTIRYAPGDHEGAKFVDLSIVSRDGRFVH